MPIRPRLGVTRLEDRTTPVVSAFEIAPIVGSGAGFDGVVNFGENLNALDSTGVVLTDARYVLTAAHCVDSNGDKIADAENYFVRFAFTTGPVVLTVPRAAITIEPRWQGSNRIGEGGDIALMRLPAIAPGGTSIGFAPYAATDELGKTVTFYGFGFAGTGTTGEASGNANGNAEVQRLAISGTGNLTLGFNGQSTTIAANITAAALQTQLQAFTGLTTVNVFTVDSPGNPNNGAFELVFENVDTALFGGLNVPQVTLTPQGGFVGTAVATTLQDGNSGGVRHVGTAVVNQFGQSGETDIFGAGFPSVAGASVLGAGDSGGPAFIDGKIAGIASYGTDESRFGDSTFWARVSVLLPTFLNPLLAQKAAVVLDMTTQPIGNDGTPDSVRVFQENYQLVVEVNGVRYLAVPVGTVSGISVKGSADGTTVNADGAYPFAVTATIATFTRTNAHNIAVGAAPGGGPRVQVIDSTNGTELASFFAFESTYTGGVNVARGDLTGDAIPDLIVTARAGGGPRVVVLDGKTGAEVRSFFAFEESFTGGVNAAVGDLNGDGIADIILTPGVGGSPRVRAFDGASGAELLSFFAYDGSFRGGATIAVGDVNGDGIADLVTAPGAGGGPNVRIFDGRTATELRSFFAFDPNVRGGITAAVGDVTGDGFAEIFVGAGVGGSPLVNSYNGQTGSLINTFNAYDSGFNGGVAVGFSPDGYGDPRLVVAPLTKPGAIKSYRFDAGNILINNASQIGFADVGASIG